jgi:hypothetical protein
MHVITVKYFEMLVTSHCFFWLLKYSEIQIIVFFYFEVVIFFEIKYCWWSFYKKLIKTF